MIPYSRPKLFNLYTLSQSKLLENHTLQSGTYLYSPYMAWPLSPPGNLGHRSSQLGSSALKNVILALRAFSYQQNVLNKPLKLFQPFHWSWRVHLHALQLADRPDTHHFYSLLFVKLEAGEQLEHRWQREFQVRMRKRDGHNPHSLYSLQSCWNENAENQLLACIVYRQKT